MAYRFSRVMMSAPKPSLDGKFYPRYPNGDNPTVAGLVGNGSTSTSAAGRLSTAILLACSALTQSSATGSLTTTPAGSGPTVETKFRPGHYYMSSSSGDVATGPSTAEIKQANSQSNWIGITCALNWSELEGNQGDYSGVANIWAAIVAINSASNGNTRPMVYNPLIKTLAFLGQANLVTALGSLNPYNTYDGSGSTLPGYLIHTDGRAGSVRKGGLTGQHLMSTDGTMYTTSFPLSTNTTEPQTGWWPGQPATYQPDPPSGTIYYGYDWQIASNFYHPVAAQCLRNLYAAIGAYVAPAFTGGDGTVYPSQTLNTHPLLGRLMCWDEEAAGLVGGSGSDYSFIGTPPTDSNVYVNATNGTGGVRFTSVLGGNVAGNSPVEVYSYREQTFIGARKDCPNTPVHCNLSFLFNSGSTFPTIAQLRTHISNLIAGGVSFNGQDIYGASFGMDFPGANPYHNQAVTNAMEFMPFLLLYVGGAYATENAETGGGAFTAPTGSTPAPGGTNWRGIGDYVGLVGQGDYSNHLAFSSGGYLYISKYTTNVVDSIWNSIQYMQAGNSSWAAESSRFLSTDETGFIYNSDGISVSGSTPVGVSGMTFSAVQQALPQMFMTAVLEVSAGAKSGSNIPLSWTAKQYPGAGLSYDILVDGVITQSVSGTTATLSGLSSGKHSIQVAMANVNGTGPPSTAISVTV